MESGPRRSDRFLTWARPPTGRRCTARTAHRSTRPRPGRHRPRHPQSRPGPRHDCQQLSRDAAPMRDNTIGALWRLTIFVVVCSIVMFGLFAVFGQLRFQPEQAYNAEFTNISGLKAGNFVRIAGVEVGQVKHISIRRDNIVVVRFSIDDAVVLTGGSKALIRYDNVIGDRYMELQDGPGATARLTAGQTIPVDRTAPALDLDALIGGFRPLFRALDPLQVNALTGQLIAAFQGQGAAVSSFLAQTAAVTDTLADGDAAARTVADLLKQARPPFANTVAQSDRTNSIVLADHDYVDDLLNTLPDAYQALSRQGMYGDFFTFYLCDAVLKLNGKGGQPVYVKLAGQSTGRCTPR